MTRLFSSPFFHLFRVLFASWRFFDDTFAAPILQYRIVSNENEGVREIKDPWMNSIPKRKNRAVWNLLFNPIDHDLFARHAIVRQWLTDSASPSPNPVSLELLRNVVEFEIRKDQKNTSEKNPVQYQFRILFEGLNGKTDIVLFQNGTLLP